MVANAEKSEKDYVAQILDFVIGMLGKLTSRRVGRLHGFVFARQETEPFFGKAAANYLQ